MSELIAIQTMIRKRLSAFLLKGIIRDKFKGNIMEKTTETNGRENYSKFLGTPDEYNNALTEASFIENALLEIECLRVKPLAVSVLSSAKRNRILLEKDTILIRDIETKLANRTKEQIAASREAFRFSRKIIMEGAPTPETMGKSLKTKESDISDTKDFLIDLVKTIMKLVPACHNEMCPADRFEMLKEAKDLLTKLQKTHSLEQKQNIASRPSGRIGEVGAASASGVLSF